MKEALQQLIAKMPSLNIGLAHPDLITDTTWLNLTHSVAGKKFVYIFRSSQREMMVAHNGQITTGEWDFFANSNSMALIYQGSSYLYNALLVDGHYLVLKQDAYEEGMLFVNQAHFIALLEQYGKDTMKKVYSDLKKLAIDEWASKSKPAKEEKQEEKVAPPPVSVKKEKMQEEEVSPPLAPMKEEQKQEEQYQESPAPVEQKTKPIEESGPEEQAPIKAEKEAPAIQHSEPIETARVDILSKYRAEAQEDEGEEEETPSLFNAAPKETLNDRLKQQLKQNKQPSLLEKLQEEQKRK